MTPRDAKDGTSRVRGKVFIARDGKISTVCHSCSAEVCITDQLRTILGVADKKPAIAKAVVPA